MNIIYSTDTMSLLLSYYFHKISAIGFHIYGEYMLDNVYVIDTRNQILKNQMEI